MRMLEFMCDTFGRTQSLYLLLQSSTDDFRAAVNLLDAFCTDLKESKAQDQHSSKLWTGTLTKCDIYGIETGGDIDNMKFSRPTGRGKLPASTFGR